MFLATPRPEAPQLTDAMGLPPIGWEPALWVTAQRLAIELPLRRGLFGYKDAAGHKVRKNDYMHLVRATKRGRTAITTRTLGIVATTVGWTAAMGFGTARLVDPTSTLEDVGATGGLVVGLGGMIAIAVGHAGIRNAVRPLPP